MGDLSEWVIEGVTTEAREGESEREKIQPCNRMNDKTKSNEDTAVRSGRAEFSPVSPPMCAQLSTLGMEKPYIKFMKIVLFKLSRTTAVITAKQPQCSSHIQAVQSPHSHEVMDTHSKVERQRRTIANMHKKIRNNKLQATFNLSTGVAIVVGDTLHMRTVRQNYTLFCLTICLPGY